jgi:fructan beta-fructosidase
MSSFRIRTILVTLCAIGLAFGAGPAIGAPTSGSGSPPPAYDQQYRPQFHFSPAENWMNDPNGLIFYQGRYHLFFQYNPSGTTWGNISWGHAVSRDLTHWRQLPLAIPQDDSEYVFSGSVVVDTGNTSGFGTAARPALVAIYTSAYKASGMQAQSLAYSTDGGLTFTKYAGNPVIDLASTNFRDPHVFWYAPAREWRMVVALSADHKISIYRSADLKSWTHLSDFGPLGAVGGVWECPDLFPLAVDGNPHKIRWVMVVNINPGGIAGGSGAQYFTGSFDGTTFTPDDTGTYTPPTGAVLQNFESGGYAPWTTTGTAFGAGPATGNLAGQGGVAGFEGTYLANSFHGGDGPTGVLTSPSFTITQGYLNFLIGGGNHPHIDGRSLDLTPPPGPVFADFEGSTYGDGWTTTGDFVGTGPVPGTIGDQQTVSGYLGTKLVNTFLDHDRSTGTITSPAFTISSDYIDLLVGGGNHPYPTDLSGATAVNLIVGGQVVATASGQDSEAANWIAWNVAQYRGRSAQIQVVDQNTGGWGHILLDNIVFSGEAAVPVSTETSANLVVDGTIVRTATGANTEALDWVGWDVRDLVGRPARVELIDKNTGGFGHLTADQFTLADAAAQSATQRAHWMDYGRDFYAAASYNNLPANQRTVIAWMNNWDYAGNIPTSPWRSAMSVPRRVTLERVNGTLRLIQQPSRQLRSLRRPHPFTLRHPLSVDGTTTLPVPAGSGTTAEVVATFDARRAQRFGLNVRVGGTEKTVVGYDVHRGGLYLDRTRSGDVGFSTAFPSTEFAPLTARNGTVTLHLLIDRSSVEVLDGRGRAWITDQIFPSVSSTAIQVFAEGGRAQLRNITVWNLKSTWG